MNTEKKIIMGEGKGEEAGLRYERKQFLDKVRGLKVGETDERVIFVICVVVSSLTGA